MLTFVQSRMIYIWGRVTLVVRVTAIALKYSSSHDCKNKR